MSRSARQQYAAGRRTTDAMQEAMEALGTFTGRTGRLRDIKALGEAFIGFWFFLRTCRPIRYQAMVALLLGVGVWLWGGGFFSWLLWGLGICVGLWAEANNSSHECDGATLAKVAFMVNCVASERHEALLDQHGEPLPLNQIPRQADPEFARNAHQSAAITVVAAFTVSILYAIIMIYKP